MKKTSTTEYTARQLQSSCTYIKMLCAHHTHQLCLVKSLLYYLLTLRFNRLLDSLSDCLRNRSLQDFMYILAVSMLLFSIFISIVATSPVVDSRYSVWNGPIGQIKIFAAQWTINFVYECKFNNTVCKFPCKITLISSNICVKRKMQRRMKKKSQVICI